MRIKKIYNNNVISILNSENEEMIITGAGIGFKKKINDLVDESKITQIFYLEDDKKKKVHDLLARVPIEYFELCEEIIKKAEIELNKKMDSSVIIAFTDHIAGAIMRAKENMILPNLTLMEVKTIWKKEFEFSVKVIDYVKEKTGVTLPIDEAGYIAIYFVSDSHSGTAESIELLDSVTDIVKIIEESYQVLLDKTSLSYMRLVTHLRFFIGRIKNKETKESFVNQGIYQLLVQSNPKLPLCSERISQYMLESYEYEVSEAEVVYLMIHITQILGK